MLHIHREPNSVHRDCVENRKVIHCVAVVLRYDVMPHASREMRLQNTGRFPRFRAVIERAPFVRNVIGLPSKVIDVAAEDLLALKLKCLRRVLHSNGNEKVERIGELCKTNLQRRVNQIEISIGIWHGSRNGKLRTCTVFRR